MNRLFFWSLVLSVSVPAAGVDVYDDDIQEGQIVTWTADNEYILKEKIFVEEGAELTIEAGTVIKGEPYPGAQATALIICRGAKLFANGTKDSPIIFTTIADDLLPFDQTALDVVNTNGLWGGVVLLGRAVTNAAGGYGYVEGVDITEERGRFGGNDDADNSGVLRYVSIRYAGMEVAPNVELNGLTMGAVGSGTTIDFVEVFNNADDAFEWFGGCVNTSHLLAVNCFDDGFDYDQGFRGRGQFWCVIHGATGPDSRCGEHDGAVSPITAEPYSKPIISNVTYVAKNDYITTLMFRENAGGKYINSIFHDCGDVFIEHDTHARYEAGDILLANNIFWAAGRPSTWGFYDPYNSVVTQALEAGANELINPRLNRRDIRMHISYPRGEVDLRPTALPARQNIYCVDTSNIDTSGFIQQVCYKGAFDPTQAMWVRGWTAFDFYGYMHSDDTPPVASLDSCCEETSIDHQMSSHQSASPFVSRDGRSFAVRVPSSMHGTIAVELFDMKGSLIARSTLVPDGTSQPTVHLRVPSLAVGRTVICRLTTGRTALHVMTSEMD